MPSSPWNHSCSHTDLGVVGVERDAEELGRRLLGQAGRRSGAARRAAPLDHRIGLQPDHHAVAVGQQPGPRRPASSRSRAPLMSSSCHFGAAPHRCAGYSAAVPGERVAGDRCRGGDVERVDAGSHRDPDVVGRPRSSAPPVRPCPSVPSTRATRSGRLCGNRAERPVRPGRGVRASTRQPSTPIEDNVLAARVRTASRGSRTPHPWRPVPTAGRAGRRRSGR